MSNDNDSPFVDRSGTRNAPVDSCIHEKITTLALIKGSIETDEKNVRAALKHSLILLVFMTLEVIALLSMIGSAMESESVGRGLVGSIVAMVVVLFFTICMYAQAVTFFLAVLARLRGNRMTAKHLSTFSATAHHD